MHRIITKILQWAELWALFIPLSTILLYKIKAPETRPIRIFLWITLVVSVFLTIISNFKDQLPEHFRSNIFCYNLLAVLKVSFFGWYITQTPLLKPYLVFKLIIPVYLILVILNFIFLESVLKSSHLLNASESIMLLGICISYLLLSIRDDSEIIWTEQNSFLLCMSVSFYEAMTFFIFLFLMPIDEYNHAFATLTMEIFSLCYIIFCILIAIFLYRFRTKKEYSSITMIADQ